MIHLSFTCFQGIASPSNLIYHRNMKRCLILILIGLTCFTLHSTENSVFYAVIDSITGTYAAVYFGDEKELLLIPVEILPKDAQEGFWYRIVIEYDDELTRRRTESVRRLLASLTSCQEQ